MLMDYDDPEDGDIVNTVALNDSTPANREYLANEPEKVQEETLDILRHYFSTAEVDVDETDENGLTALMWAARLKMSDVVAYLIRQEAQLDLADNDGRTALMWAEISGDKKSGDALTAAGAAPTPTMASTAEAATQQQILRRAAPKLRFGGPR